MNNRIKPLGEVFYFDIDADSEYRPYAAFLNDAISHVVFDPKQDTSHTSIGADDWFEVTVRNLTVRYMKSGYCNDHYYVFVGQECVYHCQDSSGRLTVCGHIPGPWVYELAALAG